MLTLTASAMAGNGELRVIDSTTRKDLFQRSPTIGSGLIEARDFHVKTRFPSGKETPNEFLVIFDPRSHYYIWLLHAERGEPNDPDPLGRLASRSAIAVGSRGMAWFLMGQPSLFVRESSQVAIDLDDAGQRSLQQATVQLAWLSVDLARQAIQIEIGKQLANIGQASKSDFFAPLNRVDIGPFPVKLDSVYVDGTWEITVEANLKAKVTLTDRFELLKVEQFK